jgi:hypothetical protein
MITRARKYDRGYQPSVAIDLFGGVLGVKKWRV